ncbi:phospholipase D family protein [Streptomyces sp. NBC_01233]|uniref:phospholipase D family protein n=1 Tax=Streptomyces sp. NBC_01233 TaxID=2903787 RepID=UPI002E164D90|nr:phospholipase D family protein [Streptomyces sp. NBC_01233]
MKLRFAGQPFADHPNLVDFIEHARDDGFDELKIAVAWAKRSGLGRVWDVLEEFRAQGGKVLLILGVSEGGATREGLELALQVADEGYVFHDPRRTFHPKVYFACSSGQRSLLVGSSNLTAGGLSWNYEASMWVDWDAGEGEDVTDEVSAWFDSLIAKTESCSPLTAELITDLEKSGDIVIGSESRARRVQKKKSDTPEDNDSAIVATISGLFKPVLAGLRKLPGLSSKIAPITSAPGTTVTKKPAIKATGASGTPATVKKPALAGPAPFPTADVHRRWFKHLDNTAAQQVKSAASNPTGNLRLSQEDASIDHKHYFRDDFFGGLPWTPTEGKDTEQEVVVGFRTWIDGTDLGIQELRLSHDPKRISGQGNVPTVLHWGALASEMRETNYVGLYISLECTTGGEYNLVISQAPRGDYQI